MSNEKQSYRVLRSEKECLKLVAANCINRFGDSIDAIAFSWMMYQITQSAALMALIVGLNYLPTILLQPFAGAWVDRMRKKCVMVLCDIGRGVVVAVAVALLWTGAMQTWMLIAMTMLNSVLEAFRQPAGTAVVPLILQKEHYTVGMSLNSTLCRVMELIGLALAGAALAVIGSAGALLIDAATFFISAGIIACIRVPEKAMENSANLKAVLHDFTEGAKTLLHSPLMLTLGLLGMLINFGTVPLSAFGTAFVVDCLHAGPEVSSAMELVLVAGMALGAYITPKMSRLSNRWAIILFGVDVALSMLLMAAAPSLQGVWLSCGVTLVSSLLMGVGVGVINVIYASSLMHAVPEGMMGRISGTFNALLVLILPLGSFLCSAMANVLTIVQVMLVFGVFLLLLYLGMIFVPTLKEV